MPAVTRLNPIRQLYSNDNWVKRRRLLFQLISWKVGFATAIMIFGLFGWGASETLVSALISVALPALLTGIAAESGLYIFGANQDDKDKRDKIANTPVVAKPENMTEEERHAVNPPEDWMVQ